MKDIMVDLETLSTRTNATIIAIGAVKFSTERGVYGRFYQPVKSEAEAGFHISSATVAWWANQSEEARAVFTDPNATAIRPALASFSDWVLNATDKKDIRLWGNGAAFDNAILSTAYTICDIEQPWNFWNDRCYRTIKALYPDVESQRLGTHHNAVNDAEAQARHLLAMGVNLA